MRKLKLLIILLLSSISISAVEAIRPSKAILESNVGEMEVQMSLLDDGSWKLTSLLDGGSIVKREESEVFELVDNQIKPINYRFNQRILFRKYIASADFDWTDKTVSYVENKDFKGSEERKILCFFDAGCEHCQYTARSLDSLNGLSDNFPELHIIFSDAEEYNIPSFFEFAGNEYPYQVMPFANYDTDEIDSYMEITFPDYDNPIVILYKGAKQIRLFDGAGYNEYHAEEIQLLLDK